MEIGGLAKEVNKMEMAISFYSVSITQNYYKEGRGE